MAFRGEMDTSVSGVRETSRRFVMIFTCVLNLFHLGYSFNVDTSIPIIHSGPRDSMFGFTVAQHIDEQGNWLLVGAPKAMTTQPQLIQPGAVYKCPADRPSGCQQIQFDKLGDKNQWNGTHMVTIEQKSGQWFGATLASSGKNGAIVACAPRYVYFTRKRHRREPIGVCYLAKAEENYESPLDYSPCKTGAWGYHRQGFCQAGFSAVLSSTGDNLVMGAVGSYYWQGQTFSQDINDESKYYETEEHQKIYDNSYMGYAAANGDFNGDGVEDYAIGIPRGADMAGQVGIFTKELNRFYNLSGEQKGEYFGTSIAVGDFNNDGLSDIAVGAPFYCDYSSDAYEMGRVYVNYQTPDPKMKFYWERTRLTGQKRIKSRFGAAVASLGDINNDDFHDLVVGAPYGGPEDRGEIYIFHGSARGIIIKPSQVITALDISPTLRTFGYSLSGGHDMDGNLYPDILVGSYISTKAIMLKARPIIRVQTELKVEPHMISLERKNCTLRNGNKVSCFAVVSCLSFSGLKVPMEITLDLEWHLDTSKDLHKRAFYTGDTEKETSMTGVLGLNKNSKRCTTAMVYIKDGIKDKLSPINIEMEYKLREVAPQQGELAPLLDTYISTKVSSQAQIQKHCGPDNICIPDLVVLGQSIGHHVLGTTSDVDLRVHVVNQGEDAFEAHVKIKLPPTVTYKRIHSVNSKHSVVCDPSSNAVLEGEMGKQGIVVTCDLGNPFPSNEEIMFMLTTEAQNVDGSSEYIKFELVANSTNPENRTTLDSNYYDVYVPIRAIIKIRVTGVSQPEQVLFNTTMAESLNSESDIGPELTHLYEVRNLGPSSIGTMSTIIHWPSFIDNDYFLYLPEVPRVVRGEGFCVLEDSSLLNPINVTVLEKPFIAYQALKAGRLKRDLQGSLRSTFSVLSDSSDELLKVECTEKQEVGCRQIRCETGAMGKDENVLIQVRSRVWMNTGLKLQENYRGILVLSQATSHVLTVPYKVKPVEYAVDTFQVRTFVAALDSGPGSQRIELWVLILAIIGGCILLLLLILLLWRCGFFMRRKAPEEKLLLHKAEKKKQQPENGRDSNGKSAYYEDLTNDEF